MPQAEAADRLSAFWDRAYAEYNVAKAMSPELTDVAGSVGVREGLGPGGDKQV